MTTTFYYASGADDASIDTNGVYSATLQEIQLLTGTSIINRFPDIGIPKNAIIQEAVIWYTVNAFKDSGATLDVLVQDIDTAPAGPPSGRTFLPAKSVVLDGTNSRRAHVTVTEQFQHLINRSDWTLGNAMYVQLKSTGPHPTYADVSSIMFSEFSTSYAAELRVVWQAPDWTPPAGIWVRDKLWYGSYGMEYTASMSHRFELPYHAPGDLLLTTFYNSGGGTNSYISLSGWEPLYHILETNVGVYNDDGNLAAWWRRADSRTWTDLFTSNESSDDGYYNCIVLAGAERTLSPFGSVITAHSNGVASNSWMTPAFTPTKSPITLIGIAKTSNQWNANFSGLTGATQETLAEAGRVREVLVRASAGSDVRFQGTQSANLRWGAAIIELVTGATVIEPEEPEEPPPAPTANPAAARFLPFF